MKVEFNIALPQKVTAESLVAAGILLGALSDEPALIRTQEVSYQGPHGAVHEVVLVIATDVDDLGGAEQRIETFAQATCQILNQDCIAVRLPGLSIGTLAGPKADQWGAFDNEKFIPFVVAEKQQPEK